MRKDMVRKGLVLGIIMLFIVTSVTPSILVKTVKADLNEGLVGYWSFDEGSGSTSYDSSGNNNY